MGRKIAEEAGSLLRNNISNKYSLKIQGWQADQNAVGLHINHQRDQEDSPTVDSPESRWRASYFRGDENLHL